MPIFQAEVTLPCSHTVLSFPRQSGGWSSQLFLVVFVEHFTTPEPALSGWDGIGTAWGDNGKGMVGGEAAVHLEAGTPIWFFTPLEEPLYTMAVCLVVLLLGILAGELQQSATGPD